MCRSWISLKRHAGFAPAVAALPLKDERTDHLLVSLLTAERTNSGGEPEYPFADLPPASSPIAEYRREAVGIDLRRAPQPMRDIRRESPLYYVVVGALSRLLFCSFGSESLGESSGEFACDRFG